MPRRPTIRWDSHARCWRSDVGPYGTTGRRKPVYIREASDLAGRRKAQATLEAYVRERDAEEATRTEDAANPRVWGGIVRPYLLHVKSLIADQAAGERTLKRHTQRLRRFLRFTPREGAHAGIQIAERLARSLTDDDL